jgi:hypothetical protein
MKKEENKMTFIFNGKPFEVPPGGSLGLLALGNVGVRAWKKAAAEYQAKEKKESEKNEKK